MASDLTTRLRSMFPSRKVTFVDNQMNSQKSVFCWAKFCTRARIPLLAEEWTSHWQVLSSSRTFSHRSHDNLGIYILRNGKPMARQTNCRSTIRPWVKGEHMVNQNILHKGPVTPCAVAVID